MTAPAPPARGPRGPALPPAPVRSGPDFSIAMVNIVLLLVLFFLVAGTLVSEEEARQTLPETSDLPLEALPRPLMLMAADGTLTLDGAAVPQGGVAAAVAGMERLHLLVPRDMSAAPLLAVAAEAAAAGVAVSLVTVRRAGPEGAP